MREPYLNSNRQVGTWWEDDKNDAHRNVFATVEFLDEEQSYRRDQNLHHLRLYSNRVASSLTGRDYTQSTGGNRLKINVVRSVIDAAVAQIATNRPRPTYTTEGATRTIKKRSKNLAKFVNGQFYALQQYDMSLRLFLDAAIFGTAFEHVFEKDGKIKAERVFPDEMLVDDNEARDGDPRQLFRHKTVTKGVAKALYPRLSLEIDEATVIRDAANFENTITDKISIVEAWHLPSGPHKDDGRHVIAISTATCIDEPYTSERFPFSVWRYSESPLGFFGVGLSEILASIQVEINAILMDIQERRHLQMSGLWVKKGSGITRLDNRRNAVREYKDTPPVYVETPSIDPVQVQMLQQLTAQAFQEAGISEMFGAQQKPAGLDSGEALKTYNDIGNKRQLHMGQRWETFHVRDVAELILDTARQIEARGGGDLKVLTQDNKEVEEITFSEVSVDKDKYITKVFPTSLLPDTPAGKLDTIEKLGQAIPGMQEQLLDLLDVPDLDDMRSLLNAHIRLVDHMIEEMLEKGNAQVPLPFMDLQTAQKRGILSLLRAEVEGYEEERIELLRVWLDQVHAMMTPPPAPAPPEAGAPPDAAPQPGMPVGPPMPGPMPGPGPNPSM